MAGLKSTAGKAGWSHPLSEVDFQPLSTVIKCNSGPTDIQILLYVNYTDDESSYQQQWKFPSIENDKPGTCRVLYIYIHTYILKSAPSSKKHYSFHFQTGLTPFPVRSPARGKARTNLVLKTTLLIISHQNYFPRGEHVTSKEDVQAIGFLSHSERDWTQVPAPRSGLTSLWVSEE